MTRFIVFSFSVFWAVFGFACGAPTEDSDVSDFGDQFSEQVHATGGAESEMQAVIDGEVWARRQLMVGIAETPVGPTLNRVITILRVNILDTEDGHVAVEETCATRIERPELDIIASEIPPAFIESIAVNRRSFRRVENQISFAQAVEIQGARLRDPIEDPLPESSSDSRVFDQDANGKPGVTVLISGLIQGEMHLVQRTTTRLSGTQEADRMSGLIRWTSEEMILEASDPLLTMPVNLTPHSDESRSSFSAVRIESGQSCNDILAAEQSLFE